METAGPRYEDSPTVEVEVAIAASVHEVWQLVCDIELPARFSTEFKGARWLGDADGPSVGARFVGTNERSGLGSWQTICTVTEFLPERRFGYVVEDVRNPAAAWRFELTPEDGRTRLAQWVRIGPGPSLLNLVIAERPHAERRIVAQRLADLRENMAATLAGIKDLAESRR